MTAIINDAVTVVVLCVATEFKGLRNDFSTAFKIAIAVARISSCLACTNAHRSTGTTVADLTYTSDCRVHASFTEFVTEIQATSVGSTAVSIGGRRRTNTRQAEFVAVAKVTVAARIAVGSTIVNGTANTIACTVVVYIASAACSTADLCRQCIFITRTHLRHAIAQFSLITDVQSLSTGEPRGCNMIRGTVL